MPVPERRALSALAKRISALCELRSMGLITASEFDEAMARALREERQEPPSSD